MPEPPAFLVTKNAVQSLKTLEALDQWEEVTPLGSHLLDIPLGQRSKEGGGRAKDHLYSYTQTSAALIDKLITIDLPFVQFRLSCIFSLLRSISYRL